MIMEDIQFIKKHIGKNQRLLSLDVSKNNIGLATSDSNLSLAFPLKTIKRTQFKNDIILLKKIIATEEIFALVIGFPYDGDGSLNERTQSTKDFAKEVLKHIDIPIFFQDERFSTNLVKHNNLKKNNKDIDEQAAAWFLQIFLDKLNNVLQFS
ncbi:MAG: Holliday junction resolvase RuvX [Alphaproteobacteria bacterium]|jgi:putative Holliday junction resolvase|nr:Holliday junction resolvase RuvX [Alphaproteobacteria bacterium]